jgi:glycosyltransferase involved in cell wall biosynthesis
MKPKITIVTATYYRPDLLARCITAVQQSDFKDYEHIIVSDHCPKAHQVYNMFKDDKRIRFFENEAPHIPNQGSRGQNLAIENSKSDIICYCNDDNIVMPNHLGLLYDNLSNGNNDVVYLMTHEIRIGRGNNMIQKIIARDFYKDLDPENNVKHDLLYSNPRDMSNVGHLKSVIERSGKWKIASECPEGIEDTDFLNRIDAVSVGRISNVPVYSNVYYVRNSCFHRDNVYHEKVKNLPKEQIFVYPELLKASGVLN